MVKEQIKIKQVVQAIIKHRIENTKGCTSQM